MIPGFIGRSFDWLSVPRILRHISSLEECIKIAKCQILWATIGWALAVALLLYSKGHSAQNYKILSQIRAVYQKR